jgi:hypothetical protein
MPDQEYLAQLRKQLLNTFVPDILCPTHEMPMLVEMFAHEHKAVVYCSQCGEEVTVLLS